MAMVLFACHAQMKLLQSPSAVRSSSTCSSCWLSTKQRKQPQQPALAQLPAAAGRPGSSSSSMWQQQQLLLEMLQAMVKVDLGLEKGMRKISCEGLSVAI
jgi:hypothetical protein